MSHTTVPNLQHNAKGTTLSCMIIDDEPLAVKLLQSYVEKTPGLSLKSTHNSAMQALDFLTREDVDLIFCDIQMPDLNGLQFAQIINHMKSRIIFTTAFDQYAVQSWDTNALYYLLKPIDYSSFMKGVAKAFQWFELQNQAVQTETAANTAATDEINVEGGSTHDTIIEDSFFVKSDYRLVRIRLKDILFIEGLRDYVRIYVEGRQNSVVSLMAIRYLENVLPAQQFMRIHRSYIVNLDKIEAYERGQLVFGEKRVPISDAYKEALQKYFLERTIQSKTQ